MHLKGLVDAVCAGSGSAEELQASIEQVHHGVSEAIDNLRQGEGRFPGDLAFLHASGQAFEGILEGLAQMYVYFEVGNDQVLTEGLAAVEVAVAELDGLLEEGMELGEAQDTGA